MSRIIEIRHFYLALLTGQKQGGIRIFEPPWLEVCTPNSLWSIPDKFTVLEPQCLLRPDLMATNVDTTIVLLSLR